MLLPGSSRPRKIIYFSPFSSCIEQYFIVMLFHLLFICDCFMVSFHFPGQVTCTLWMEKGSIMITFCSFFLCFQIGYLFISAACCEQLCPNLASSVMTLLRWFSLCKISNQDTNHKAHSTNSLWNLSYSFIINENNIHLFLAYPVIFKLLFQVYITKTFPISVMFSNFIIFSLQ